MAEEEAAHVEAQKFIELVRRREEERLVVEAAKREAKSKWRWRRYGEMAS